MKYDEMVNKMIVTDFKTENQYKNTKAKLNQKFDNEIERTEKKIEELKRQLHEIEMAKTKLNNMCR